MNLRLPCQRRAVARLLLLSGTALALPTWPAFAQVEPMRYSVTSRQELLAAVASVQSHPDRHHVIEVTADIALQGDILDFLPNEGRSVAIDGPGHISNGQLHKAGDGEVTLNDASTYDHVHVERGRLSIADDEALGVGTVVSSGGHLRGTKDVDVGNVLHLAGSGESRISAATGTTLALHGPLVVDQGHDIHFGSQEDQGTVVLDVPPPAGVASADVFIDGGTLRLGNRSAASVMALSRLSVQPNAVFDMNGFGANVLELAGSGRISNAAADMSDLIVRRTSRFDGQIDGKVAVTIQNGTLTLSGDNTHTGGTTAINGGLVALHSNALGTGTLSLLQGSSLDAGADLHLRQDVVVEGSRIGANGTTVTIDGVVSGAGLRKDGAGTLVLNGNNTLSGSFALNGGALVLGHEHALGSTSATLATGTTLVASRSMALANAISFANGATNRIAAADRSTFRLTGPLDFGANSTLVIGAHGYGGTVEFAHGDPTALDMTMRVASGTFRYGSRAAGAATLLTRMSLGQATTLELNGFDAFLRALSGYGTVRNDSSTRADLLVGEGGDFRGSITGNMGLLLEQNGHLTLSGDNTYAGATQILGGTLQVAGGHALPDTTDVQMTGGTLHVVHSETARSLASLSTTDRAHVSIHAGAALTVSELNGPGSFDKTGAGTLALTGAGDHFGDLDVREGTLALFDSSSDSWVTLHGGTSLLGTGQIGQLDAREGSIVAPGPFITTLNIAGDARFEAGSTFRAKVGSEGRSDRIQAGGQVVLDGMALEIQATRGSYEAQNVYTLFRAGGGVSGQAAGVTTDLAFLDATLRYDVNELQLVLQRNVVQFEEAARTRNQAAVARAADQLPSGHPVHAAILGLTRPEAPGAFDQLSGEAHASIASSLIEDSRLIRDAALERLRDPFDGAPHASEGSAGTPRSTANRPLLNARRSALWGQAVGAFSGAESDGNAAAFSRRTGGFVVGLDHPISDRLTVGATAGFTQSSLGGARAASAEIGSYHGALYAGFDLGSGWMVRAGASYTHHVVETDRVVAFNLYRDRLSANYTASTAQAFGEIAYRTSFGWGAIESFLQVAGVRVTMGRLVEAGGAAALVGAGGSHDAAFTTLGVRFALRPFADLPLTMRGMVGWRRAFGDLAPEASFSFARTTQDFRISGVPLARNSFVAELALDYRINERATLGVSYSATLGAGWHDQTVKASLSISL